MVRRAKKWMSLVLSLLLALSVVQPVLAEDKADVMTRAMAADALWKAAGRPQAEADCVFADVASSSAEAIAWAAEIGVMVGYGGNIFGADDPVTREQMASVLWRYAKYCGNDVSAGEDTNILSYTDAFDISEYAFPALQWACAEDIINGSDDGVLDPGGPVRTDQAAQMLLLLTEK